MANQVPTPPESVAATAAAEQAALVLPGTHEEFLGSEPPSPQLQRYLSAVLRHKWAVLLVTLVGTGLGFAGSKLVRPLYQAQATLWVEASARGAEDQGPIRSGHLLESFAWIELLKSYTVLDHVVEQQRLYVAPSTPQHLPLFRSFALAKQFRPGKYDLRVAEDGKTLVLSSQGTIVEQTTVGSPVGGGVGLDWEPTAGELKPGQTVSFVVTNPRDVAVELGEQLQTRMAQDGNFLSLSLQGTDPEQVAATLNALTDRYVDVAAQLKRAKLDELTAVLAEQRRYAERNLYEAEIALENFRVETITLPSDESTPIAAGLEITRDPVFESFFALRLKREQLKQDRLSIGRILSQAASSPRALDALAVVTAVEESPGLVQALAERNEKRAALRALEQRYTEEHRRVRDLRQELFALERQTIPTMAASLDAQLAGREGDLEKQIGEVSGELREIPARAIEEARLRRQVGIAENLHTTLKQRYEEARLAAASSIPDIRLLDRAVVPSQPVQDNRPLFLLMGLLGSFGIGVIGSILLDRMDPRVRYPDQVTHGMGLSILGAIPNIKAVEETSAASRAHAAEAIRELRLSLLHAHGAAGPLQLTITSPESGEGKSFLTINLGLAFTEQGFETVIVDGDTRRGRIHQAFGTPRVPGLTDYLAGTATSEQIIQPTSSPHLFTIPSGTRMHNGPELLSSKRMTQLLVGLRSRFGVILVDSPPLGAGVDAYALGAATGNMVLVIRTGRTNRSFAEAKLTLLERLPIRLLGSVLNDTPASRLYGYHYYLPGYEAADEAVREAPVPVENA